MIVTLSTLSRSVTHLPVTRVEISDIPGSALKRFEFAHEGIQLSVPVAWVKTLPIAGGPSTLGEPTQHLVCLLAQGLEMPTTLGLEGYVRLDIVRGEVVLRVADLEHP